MAISRVEIKDFLVFKGDFAVDFCPGVNVLIGGNATGKTTLLKVMYAGCKFSFLGIQGADSPQVLNYYFDRNYRITSIGGFAKTIVENNFIQFSVEAIDKVGATLSTQFKLSAVYIPNDDILSHSKGFLALNNERKMPFDQTQIDILSKAEIPETQTVMPNAEKTLNNIKTIIGGDVLYEQDVFFIKKDGGILVPFSFEASGYRKFGLLWKLLRNGLLEDGTVLFWDEPENSLNPELVPKLVDILLELSRNGVQIFLATHSEILASYFAANRQKGDNVMFYALYKDGDQIKYDHSDRFDLLEPNNLMSEPVKLYEKQIERGLGGNE